MDFYDYIEDYKKGNLNEEVRQKMEQAMSRDESLRLALDNYDSAKSLSEGLLEIDIMQSIEQLADRDKKSSNTISIQSKTQRENKSTLFKLPTWLVAASLIGVIALSTLWVVSGNNEKNKLWTETYRPPIDRDLTRSGELSEKDDFAKGKYYALLNDYDKSIEALNITLKTTTNQDTVQQAYYWLGHNYLKMDQYDNAIEAFGKSKVEGSKDMISLAKQLQALD